MKLFVHRKKIIRIFAAVMEKEKIIENAVCEFYKVDPNEVYTSHKSRYPMDAAKRVLMYLLYAEGVKVYDIADAFEISERLVYRNVAEVQVALKSDTKIKEDITAINKLLNNE